MKVHHEKFGIGEVVNSTEKLDEAGNIISADVMFEHGIEQDLQIPVDEEVEEIDETSTEKLGKYVVAAAKDMGNARRDMIAAGTKWNGKAGIRTLKRSIGIDKAVNKIGKNAQNEEVEEIEEKLIGNQKKIDANKNGKIDAEDFKKLRKEEVAESVVVTSRVTPDSAALRMPAVENVVRDIMSQHRNLRQEAKENEFKSRNK